VAAYNQKRRLAEATGIKFAEDMHRKFVGEDITGIDIMPFAAHLAVVHLSLQAPNFITQKVRVAVEDSTKVSPFSRIPSITRELAVAFKRPTLEMFMGDEHPKDGASYIEKGAVTANGIGGEEIPLEPVDVVIMNPPFTSSDNLGAPYKDALRKRFGADFNRFLQGKISFQGHFLVLADRFLKEGGRLAAVLPQTTLTGEAFGPLVQMLAQRYTIITVVTGLGRAAFSENTAFSEILLVAQKGPPPSNYHFPLVGTKVSPIDWNDRYIGEIITRLRSGVDYSDETLEIRRIPQDELDIKQGGITKFLPSLQSGYQAINEAIHDLFDDYGSMVTYDALEDKSGFLMKISSLANKEEEGVNGRGNVYFGTQALNIIRAKNEGEKNRRLRPAERLIFLKADDKNFYVKDRITSFEYVIPKKSIVPSIRSMSHQHKMNATEDSDWVISTRILGLEKILNDIYGKDKTLKYQERISTKWPKRVSTSSVHLHVSYKVDITAPGTVHLAIYTDEPSFAAHRGWGINCSKVEAKILCLWFNSSFFLYQLLTQRIQVRGGYWRLDKKRFARLFVPDVTQMDKNMKGRLCSIFDRFGKADFPSLMEQFRTSYYGRWVIDMEFVLALGKDEHFAEMLIARLYPYMYETLSQLKQSMDSD
jgi:hypothetical protein